MFKVKGSTFRSLDISNIPISSIALRDFPIKSMTGLEELKMCECFAEPMVADINNFVTDLFDTVQNTLRNIDFSLNTVSREAMNHFLQTISKKGRNLEALSISQVNLQKPTLPILVSAIQNMTVLKKLNISGNDKISQVTMQQILKALIQGGTIEDLNIGQTGVNNDQTCVTLLGELVTKNKALKSLHLESLNLTENTLYSLVGPLSQSLNVETINLDFNNLGASFIQALVEKLIANKGIDNLRASNLLNDS
jgi:Ran GTPase-activating protein (RanGAP) involved in mRNA processing and transport